LAQDITLFDLSDYQENPALNQYINWIALKGDPFNFQGGWIKVSEGSIQPGAPGAYDIEGPRRQYAGARSVKFPVINGYHFWWYEYWGLVNGAYQWIPIPGDDQAAAFFAAYQAAGIPTVRTYDKDLADWRACHPMADLEDPLIVRQFNWGDTANANRSLVIASAMNKNLYQYFTGIKGRFGVYPDAYSGDWWLKQWFPFLKYYRPDEVLWWDDINFILADYDGTFTMPTYIKPAQVIGWQKTSTPDHNVAGIPTGHVKPGDAFDVDQWMGLQAAYDLWRTGAHVVTVDERLSNLEKWGITMGYDPNKQY